MKKIYKFCLAFSLTILFQQTSLAQCSTSATAGSSSNMFTLIRNSTNPIAADKNLNTISLHGKNNIALSKKKMVAFLGVSNLCIIETDDIILIKDRGESDSIKDLMIQLKSQGHENLL